MPINPFLIEDTFTLLSAIEQIKEPLSFLADRFFGEKTTVNTSTVAVEYRSEHRILAPMIVKNSRGVDVNRGSSKIKYYAPLLFGPRRVIGLGDVERRLFGEIPNLYTPVKPEERAAKMQAEDLADLTRLHANRREQLAAQLLQHGKIDIKGYADDGRVEETDTIDFDWDGAITPLVSWSNANADIYGDLRAVSERIQRRCGIIPTVAICGSGVEEKLLNNTALNKYMMIPLRENMSFASWAPTWTSPEVRYIGRVQALNMEFYSYAKTYMNEQNQVVPYIEDNKVIVATPNIGRTIYAPVTIFNKETGWQTIAAPIVPKYSADEEAQTLSLTLYSRYVLVPNVTDTWCTLSVQ